MEVFTLKLKGKINGWCEVKIVILKMLNWNINSGTSYSEILWVSRYYSLNHKYIMASLMLLKPTL